MSPIEFIPNFGYGLRLREAPRCLLAAQFERTFPRVRIGAILHPAVFLAFLDGAGLLQHRDRPSA